MPNALANNRIRLKYVAVFLLTLSFTTSASEGGVTVTDKGLVGKTAYYDVRSNSFKGSQFSAQDIDNYAQRVGKRNCLDPELAEARKIGMKWHYDFYGVDKVKAGAFTVSIEICRRNGWM